MPLLSTADYDAVRGAIDSSLVGDTKILPDATIDLAIYEPSAEAEVLRRVPNAATLTGDAGDAVTRAVIYLTAARLALALPSITAEKLGTYSYNRDPADPVARAATLRQQASAEIALAGGAADELPTQFTRACAGRRRGLAWAR